MSKTAIDLQAFLLGSSTTAFFDKVSDAHNRKISLGKISMGDPRFTYISCDQYSSEWLSRPDKDDIIGIYDEDRKVFYESGAIRLMWDTDFGQMDVVKRSSIHGTIETIVGLVNRSIDKFKKENRDELIQNLFIKDENWTDTIIKNIVEEARKICRGGDRKDAFSSKVAVKAFTEFDVVRFLMNQDDFVEVKAKDYIVENELTMAKSIFYEERLAVAIDGFQGDSITAIDREIVKATSDKHMKTLNVTLKDKEEIVIKVNNVFSPASRNISPYNITKPKDRELFEETFGRHNNINFSMISKITYGKKILFERVA